MSGSDEKSGGIQRPDAMFEGVGCEVWLRERDMYGQQRRIRVAGPIAAVMTGIEASEFVELDMLGEYHYSEPAESGRFLHFEGYTQVGPSRWRSSEIIRVRERHFGYSFHYAPSPFAGVQHRPWWRFWR